MVQGSVEKTSQRAAGGPEAEDLTQNARYKCNEQRYGCHSGQYKHNLTTPSGNTAGMPMLDVLRHAGVVKV